MMLIEDAALENWLVQVRAASSQYEANRDKRRATSLKGPSFFGRLADEDIKVRPARTTLQVGAVRRERATGGVALVAAGYQPAVLKIISYGHGLGAASRMSQYVQRDAAKLETDDGRILNDKEAVASEMTAWSASFDTRKPSDDVATLKMTVGLPATSANADKLKQMIGAAFKGHNHAYALGQTPEGNLEAQVVVSLAGSVEQTVDAETKMVSERFWLTDRRSYLARNFTRKSLETLSERAVSVNEGLDKDAVSFKVDRAFHGKNGATYALAQLAKQSGAVVSDGQSLVTEGNVRAVSASWAKDLRSLKPRDTMHMVLSAKAGNDPDAVKEAARAFLKETFENHKYAFALHTDKLESAGHMHVHAIVAVRSETGEKLKPGPAQLRAWRQVYAQHAQAQGIKIVATSAMERASRQSYGSKDKAIVDAAQNPRQGREMLDVAYARRNVGLIQNAKRRIERAKLNPVRIPATDHQLAAARESLAAWAKQSSVHEKNSIAQSMFARMTSAVKCAMVYSQIRNFQHSFGREVNMNETTAQQMRADLRELNVKVADASATLDGEDRKAFMHRTAEAMETLALRTDLQTLKESGATTITTEHFAHLAGNKAARLVERAQTIAAVEAREANDAERIAVNIQNNLNKDSANPGFNPTSLDEIAAERDALREAETIAARERREAAAAAKIAQELQRNPDKQIQEAAAENSRLKALRQDQKAAIEETNADNQDGPDRERPARQRM